MGECQVLIFKKEVTVKMCRTGWYVGRRIFPLDVFRLLPVSSGELMLAIRTPWVMDPDELVIDDHPGLHRCIRSQDPAVRSRYYVPSLFLKEIVHAS